MRRGQTWTVVGLVALVGLNLRATLGSLPPLLPDIAADLQLPSSALGMLSSLCILGMGLAAPFGQALADRLGAERALVWLLVALGASELVRFTAFSPLVLYASVAVAGATMGAASTLMPGFIGHHASAVRGFVTGVYSTGLALGVALAAAIAVPLSLAWGWRASLASVGVLALLTALVVRLAAPGEDRPAPRVRGRAKGPGLPWRDPTARLLTALNIVVMVTGFTGLAWIAPYYRDLGRAPTEAAAMTVVFQVVQLVGMLGFPAITDATRDRRPLVALTLLCSLAGSSLLVLAPGSFGLAAVLLFGLGAGGLSTLLLVLSVDVSANRAAAARLNGLTLFVGFTVGALGPFLMGVVRDLTGSLAGGYLCSAGLLLLGLGLVPFLHPGRRVLERVPAIRHTGGVGDAMSDPVRDPGGDPR